LSRINEEKVLASLYVNLKGPKKKQENWIEIATSLKKLSDYYGSPQKAAEKLGVSNELVKSILRVLNLPDEAQDLIREGKILYDAAQRLERIHDRSRQKEVAKAIVGLTSHEARDLIQYARKYPKANVSGYRKRLANSKGKTERINVIVLPVREETYSSLRRMSKREGVSIEKLVSNILQRWLSNNERAEP
jgi:hypothetical protein